MAVRKNVVKQQMTEFVEGLLKPEEAIRGGALGQSGPMPGLFGLVGMLFIKQYYVALTSDRVIFVRASQLNGRPISVDFEDRRDAARAEHGVEGRFWSTMTYKGSRTVKLRYPKLWREDMKVILHALGEQTS
ncbi:MAG TPA: hypothetical protein VIG64_11595 [Actinomycetota bacterium]